MVLDMKGVNLVTFEPLRGFLAVAVDLGLTQTAAPAARYGFNRKVFKRFKHPAQDGSRLVYVLAQIAKVLERTGIVPTVAALFASIVGTLTGSAARH